MNSTKLEKSRGIFEKLAELDLSPQEIAEITRKWVKLAESGESNPAAYIKAAFWPQFLTAEYLIGARSPLFPAAHFLTRQAFNTGMALTMGSTLLPAYYLGKYLSSASKPDSEDISEIQDEEYIAELNEQADRLLRRARSSNRPESQQLLEELAKEYKQDLQK